MAVALVAAHTSGSSTAAGTTVSFTLASSVAVGNLIMVWVGFDNTGTSTPTVSTIARQSGETASWVRVAQHNSSIATSGGGVRGEMWVIVTTVVWSAAAYTVTLSASVTSKVTLCAEFSGASTTIRGTAGTGTATNGQPTATTSGTAPAAGDLVLGGAAFENNANPNSDVDTTGGTVWNNLAAVANTGTALTSVAVCAAYKVPTSSAQQTYNPTGANDSGSCAVALVPAVVATGRPKIYTGSVWVQKPAKVWNGSTWTEKPVKVYTGSVWKTVT